MWTTNFGRYMLRSRSTASKNPAPHPLIRFSVRTAPLKCSAGTPQYITAVLNWLQNSNSWTKLFLTAKMNLLRFLFCVSRTYFRRIFDFRRRVFRRLSASRKFFPAEPLISADENNSAATDRPIKIDTATVTTIQADHNRQTGYTFAMASIKTWLLCLTHNNML